MSSSSTNCSLTLGHLDPQVVWSQRPGLFENLAFMHFGSK